MMSDFGQRLGTGVLFFIFIIGGSIYSPLSFGATWLLAAIMGQIEFYRLIKKSGGNPQLFGGILIGFSLFVTNFAYVQSQFQDWYFLLINIPLVYFVFLIEVFRKHKNPFFNISYTLAGVIYIALPFTMLNYLVVDIQQLPAYNFSPWVLAGIIMTLWANDSWAYIWGSLFGKHKLFPSISPGKTWEGFIGGLMSAWLWAYLMFWLIDTIDYFENKNIEWIDWIVISTILSVIGTLGDLVESKLKRSLNIKDSGSFLPGHGGILDRFDALIMSIPFVLVYLYIKYCAFL